MALEDYVRLVSREPLLPFLLIGGYAVAAHGHVRATFDVDFLADHTHREQWLERARESGFAVLASNDVFIQFEALEGKEPLDLMFVDPATFETMMDASLDASIGEVVAPVPCLDHLVALKLHAMNQARPQRFSKDANDVEMLLRRHHIDVAAPRYRDLLVKPVASKSMKPSRESLTTAKDQAGCEDLVFPHCEPLPKRPGPGSVELLIRRSRQLRDAFPDHIPTPEERWRAKRSVAFVL